VRLRNVGASPLIVNPIRFTTITREFQLPNPLPCTQIVPGGSCTLTVQYAPTAPGTQSTKLAIGSNDPGAGVQYVEIMGTATAVVGTPVGVMGVPTTGKPDLTVKITSAGPVTRVDTDLVARVDVQVTNLGGTFSGPFAIQFLVNDLLQSVEAKSDGLQPGQAMSSTQTVRIAERISGKKFELKVIADGCAGVEFPGACRVDESNENNNAETRLLPVP
jgi:hypothetical protein